MVRVEPSRRQRTGCGLCPGRLPRARPFRPGAFLILVLLAACDPKAGLPACPTPANVGWEIAWEDEERLTEASAAWTSPDGAVFDPEATEGCGTPPCLAVTGPGTVQASVILNRGVTYHLSADYLADRSGRLVLRQRNHDGDIFPILDTSIAPGPVRLDFDLPGAGNEVLLDLEPEGRDSAHLDELRIVGPQWALAEGTQAAPIQLGFLIHVEEDGNFRSDRNFWLSRAHVLEALAARLATHSARLTIQPDVSFVDGGATFDPAWFDHLTQEGVGWSVHLHDESDGATAFVRAATDAYAAFADVGVLADDLNGGFGLGAWDEVGAEGFQSLTAYKVGETQQALTLGYTTPWRPPEGSTTNNEARFVTHDPDGALIYLPGKGTREADLARVENYATRALSQALVHTRPGFVNTWYFIDHIDAFGPSDPAELEAWLADGGMDAAFAGYERFLGEVADPLVASGMLTYATPSQMAESFTDWEAQCRW